MTYEIALVTIAAAVLAGISWNTLGIWQKWREAKTEEAKIDWKRVKKNVVIGAILGIIAYGVQIGAGDSATVVDTIPGFVAVVIGFFPLVVIADKIFNRQQ